MQLPAYARLPRRAGHRVTGGGVALLLGVTLGVGAGRAAAGAPAARWRHARHGYNGAGCARHHGVSLYVALARLIRQSKFSRNSNHSFSARYKGTVD